MTTFSTRSFALILATVFSHNVHAAKQIISPLANSSRF